jgi:hypothetical protein
MRPRIEKRSDPPYRPMGELVRATAINQMRRARTRRGPYNVPLSKMPSVLLEALAPSYPLG